MTKSAKQDTKTGPAETAETESAATAGADADSAADVAAQSGTAAKPEPAAKPEAGAKSAAEDTTEDSDKPDIDDVKAKFREALDRKRQVHAEGQGKGAHEAGKVSGAHGPAASRRSFRRKSG